MHIKRTYFTIALHILVWVSLFIAEAIIFGDVKFNTTLPHYFFLYSNVFHIGLFYLNAYFIYPKLVTKKTWWLYPFAVAALLAFAYYAKLLAVEWADASFTITHVSRRILFFPPVPFIIAGIVLQVINRRIKADRRDKEQQAARLASELKFLRSQVSPHFLFNMMTNMVSLARQKSYLLEPSLMKLSELLRYMLYEQEQDKFTVEQELSYLKNYIELQQLRFGDAVDVQLIIQTDSNPCYIEPMLLVPFVENAFKHGIGLLQHPFIKIDIRSQAQQFFFKVVNNYSSDNKAKDKNSGIGLENVKSRLKLLYPGKHTLTIKEDSNIFTAELKLDLQC